METRSAMDGSSSKYGPSALSYFALCQSNIKVHRCYFLFSHLATSGYW